MDETPKVDFFSPPEAMDASIISDVRSTATLGNLFDDSTSLEELLASLRTIVNSTTTPSNQSKSQTSKPRPRLTTPLQQAANSILNQIESRLSGIYPTCTKPTEAIKETTEKEVQTPIEHPLTHLGNNMVAIKIQVNSDPLSIISSYCSPYSEIKHNLNETNNFIASLHGEDFLIGADLNAHKQSWGYNDDDTWGGKVANFILSINFQLLNTPGAPPTFVQLNSKGLPDLTIVSTPNLANNSEWIPSTSHNSKQRGQCMKLSRFKKPITVQAKLVDPSEYEEMTKGHPIHQADFNLDK
ncbi:hypothetical protein AVEN_269735-1 [Araneus ventricosus]|uniref:Endonuclease/exonuclease/phosphatase domain-containing protein n=1 Tax=Araneus ventricosus TaxID=182803 RepID=A0A4Y2EF54_ARAVE|nr:hypothetical protein AVEN_269735-1 [Araneus ventricosus]